MDVFTSIKEKYIFENLARRDDTAKEKSTELNLPMSHPTYVLQVRNLSHNKTNSKSAEMQKDRLKIINVKLSERIIWRTKVTILSIDHIINIFEGFQ